jgi:hypothetical protein
MNISGSDVSKEAANMILLGEYQRGQCIGYNDIEFQMTILHPPLASELSHSDAECH